MLLLRKIFPLKVASYLIEWQVIFLNFVVVNILLACSDTILAKITYSILLDWQRPSVYEIRYPTASKYASKIISGGAQTHRSSPCGSVSVVDAACPSDSGPRSRWSRLCASGSTCQCGEAVALCQRKSTTLSQHAAEVRSAAWNTHRDNSQWWSIVPDTSL